MFQVSQSSVRPDGTLRTQPAALGALPARDSAQGSGAARLLKEMFANTPLGLVIAALRKRP